MALGGIVEKRLQSLSKDFGDLNVDVLQSKNPEEIEAFLAILVTLEASVHNAKEAAQDRLRKLKIAKGWESPIWGPTSRFRG